MSIEELNECQLVALAAAAKRPDGALLPPQGSCDRKSIRALVAPKYVREIEVEDLSLTWRRTPRGSVGLVITDKGRDAIDISEAELKLKIMPTSKIGQVIHFVHRPHGATLSELSEITGWQTHSIRAALTTLRKKGMSIRRCESEARIFYRVGEGGPASAADDMTVGAVAAR